MIIIITYYEMAVFSYFPEIFITYEDWAFSYLCRYHYRPGVWT